ncbi:MAG: trypsin-like peptidase domain-containing protein [Fimbriimonadaceae bacterium]
MKKFGIALGVFVAAFAGVMFALRLDHKLQESDVISRLEGGKFVEVTPAQLSPGAPFDFRASAKKILPSVVSVTKTEAITDWFDRVSHVTTGTGSGVLISNDGYVVTNNHVVAGAESLTVRLADGRSVDAKLVGTDPRSDVAVIKLTSGTYSPAELGDSAKVEIGQWVMAVGNPLGYDNTLSVGVVSSLNRTLQAGRESAILSDTIQTDASINSGNSGGALTNDRGQVIGINTAIATPSGGSVGIGFAIPINRVKRVTADLIKSGAVPYGSTGFDVYELPISEPRLRRLYARQVTQKTPPANGLVILDVSNPSSGISKFDVLTEANGQKISDPIDWTKLLLDLRAGDKVNVTVWHDGQTKKVSLTLASEQ